HARKHVEAGGIGAHDVRPAGWTKKGGRIGYFGIERRNPRREDREQNDREHDAVAEGEPRPRLEHGEEERQLAGGGREGRPKSLWRIRVRCCHLSVTVRPG